MILLYLNNGLDLVGFQHYTRKQVVFYEWGQILLRIWFFSKKVGHCFEISKLPMNNHINQIGYVIINKLFNQ